MIKVMLVDKCSDSLKETKALFYKEDGFLVMAETSQPKKEMIKMVEHLEPDLILVNQNVALCESKPLIKTILLNRKLPIFIFFRDGDIVDKWHINQMIAVGALASLELSLSSPEHFFSSIKSLIEVPLVRRSKRISSYARTKEKRLLAPSLVEQGTRVIGIGSSTGGPKTLEQILTKIEPGFLAPIVVIQHISSGFTEALVDWLRPQCNFMVKVACDKQILSAGTVYFAPDGYHLTLHKIDQGILKNIKANKAEPWFVRLNKNPEVHGVRPSVDVFFSSMAACCGAGAMGVLLTGMGSDGADGLRQLHDKRAVTLVQDKESSVIWGMPGAAVAINAVDRVLGVEDIVEEINKFSHYKN